MAKKAQLTASLPKLAVTPEIRERIEKVADLAEVGMADVVRDCIEAVLPEIERQLGIVQPADVETRIPVVESRAAGCAWGLPLQG